LTGVFYWYYHPHRSISLQLSGRQIWEDRIRFSGEAGNANLLGEKIAIHSTTRRHLFLDGRKRAGCATSRRAHPAIDVQQASGAAVIEMRKMKRAILGILLLAVGLPVSAQQSVYLDPSQPMDKRVDDLLQRLTPDEKTSLLSTTAPAIERLKIPAMNGWNQSLHGIVWTKPTTMFPVPISMAATWDPALVHDVAASIADEGRAIYNYWPTVSGKTELVRGQAVTVTASGERVSHKRGRAGSTSHGYSGRCRHVLGRRGRRDRGCRRAFW